MPNREVDRQLDKIWPFELSGDTTTRISKHNRLLLGPTTADLIDKILPTTFHYLLKEKVFRASYIVGVDLTGIGVLDEWREIPSKSPFNVYGFDYEVGGEFRFRASLLGASTSSVPELVEMGEMNPVESVNLQKYMLGSAISRLATLSVPVAGTIVSNV